MISFYRNSARETENHNQPNLTSFFFRFYLKCAFYAVMCMVICLVHHQEGPLYTHAAAAAGKLG